MKLIIFLFLSLIIKDSISQKIFTEAEFIAAVKTFHPLARKAELDVKIAEAAILISRSEFDPVLSMQQSRKELEGNHYYSQQVNEIKIPTWYGADLVIGKENISGLRINPEHTEGSVSYIGFSIPLIRNLVMDKRRAVLQQARQYLLQSEMQRQQNINDLKRNALHAYWSWWQHYQLYQVMETSRLSAEKRFSMVKTLYNNGDRPAIDTIEALTIVQYFFQKQYEANLFLQKAKIELSGYLWKENDQPYELPDDVSPQPFLPQNNMVLADALQSAENHPELKEYQFKQNAMEIQRKLKFQSLLPEFNLKYNQLGKQKNILKTVNGPWFENNYQFGVSLSMPLRLSEGRGEYRKTKFYLEQIKLEQINKRVQIQNKTKQFFAEWEITREQLAMQQQYVNNMYRLQKGEESRFLNGESSLFIINARELKTLESKEKLLEFQAKNIRSFIDLKWSTGLIE